MLIFSYLICFTDYSEYFNFYRIFLLFKWLKYIPTDTFNRMKNLYLVQSSIVSLCFYFIDICYFLTFFKSYFDSYLFLKFESNIQLYLLKHTLFKMFQILTNFKLFQRKKDFSIYSPGTLVSVQ